MWPWGALSQAGCRSGTVLPTIFAKVKIALTYIRVPIDVLDLDDVVLTQTQDFKINELLCATLDRRVLNLVLSEAKMFKFLHHFQVFYSLEFAAVHRQRLELREIKGLHLLNWVTG